MAAVLETGQMPSEPGDEVGRGYLYTETPDTHGTNLPNVSTSESGSSSETIRDISVIVPAWNEVEHLGATLERYLPVLESIADRLEVLVIVDGPPDGTREVVQKFAERDVRLIEFPERLGKGGALIEGMKAAQYDCVGFIDADGPVSPDDLRSIISKVTWFDSVIGSRWIDGSHFVQPQTLGRIAAGRVWNILVRLFLSLPLADTQCGVKFFRKDSLRRALGKVTVTNWAFDAALLYEILQTGGTVMECPVTWSDRPQSKLTVSKAAPAMLASLVSIRASSSRMWRIFPPRLLARVASWDHKGPL